MDSSNNFAILGVAANGIPVDIDPNPNVSNMIQDKSFVLFLDANANYYDSKLFDLNISMSAIEIDNLNNYHIGGVFKENNMDFDPSANTYYMSATGLGNVGYYTDAFYLKLNSNRDFVQSFKIGTIDVYNSSTICWNSNVSAIKTLSENIYIAGGFSGTCDLDPRSATSYFLNSINTGVINFDGYILKLGNCDTLAPVGDNNQIFCSSQNPTINNLSPNAVVIKWYDSATSTNQLSNITPLINGQTYYASKQIGSCPESQRLTVTATIIQTPPPPISTSQSFCENENATISNLIVTGQNVKWYSLLTNTNTLPTNTALANNTNYYATQTVNGCESNRTIVNVTINSVTSPTIVSPQTFCIQQNSNFEDIVVSGQNIKWYDAAIGGNLLSNTSSLIHGQTYYASQTIDSCESLRTPVLIDIQNAPAPTGTANQTFCSAQNPTLNDIVVNGTDLKWYNSDMSTTVLLNTTQLVDGITYYATQVANNCESVNRLAVTVDLINTINANDYSEAICDNLNDGSEIINIPSYNTNLISNTSNCTFEYYSSLLGATNQTITDLISPISNYNLTNRNQTFFIRITSINGCHQIVKLYISLVSKPIISINDIVPICENKNTTVNAGLGFDRYNWSTGATSQSIIITKPGNYSVTVTKSYGTTVCSSTKNFAVVLSNVATITKFETQDWTDNENILIVNTSANSYGDYEFSIDGINYQDSNVFSGLISGPYSVYVRDKNGCGIAKDEIFLLMYPKFFTPNGDGYNDTWAIKFSHIEPNFKVSIFDRYGKLLKTLNNLNSWDGKYNGNDLPSTDYWFVVTRENGKDYRGHFALKR
jgi:gliding motility-associated-like protein